MKQRNYLLALAGTCFAGLLSAQVTFTTREFYPNGVNNDGVVVGSRGQYTERELWYPSTGQMIKIGGISSGNGEFNAGGRGRFSNDGKKISSTMIDDAVPLPTELRSVVSSTLSDFTFGKVSFTQERKAYTVGSSADKERGIILVSSSKGQTWRETKDIQGGGQFSGGLVSIGVINYTSILVGGHKGAIYYTLNEGRGWVKYEVRPDGNTKAVDTYWAIDFIPEEAFAPALRGAIGVEYTDGSYAVWQTEDGGNTLKEATGVSGVPTCIGHFADRFYMTTRNGYAQKSTDAGKTWTNMFVTENSAPLNSIAFMDENVGMASAQGVIYVTTDGGSNWNAKKVAEGVTDKVVWNDIVWLDGTATIVGSNNAVYETKDKGQTWSRINILKENENANLCSVAINEGATNICGTLGSVYWKSNFETVTACTAGVYDMDTQTWTPMANLGFISDGNTSNAFGISGNGEMVLGGINTYQFYNTKSAIHGHAAIWTKEGEPIDLGSKFADRNRMTRASAASFDGSVVVGCQDIWGPWYASVWRRNADGSYTQKLMLKDPDKKEEDIDYAEFGDHKDMIKNCLGLCQTVTPDGKWIGGRGEPNQSAVASPWIWSEETGLVLLDTSENPNPGTVGAMNSDASVIVGWNNFGESPWIWTKENGMMDLNDYVFDTLGADLNGYYLCTAYDMSPNGRYITGSCMKDGGKFGYMVDLMANSDNIESVALDQCRATVYPNPVSDVLHIDFPFDNVNTNISLLSLQGMVIKQINTSVISNTMYLNDVPAGLYMLDVEVEGVHKTFKIEVMR